MSWYQREDLGGGITRLTESRVHPLLRSNVWHISGVERDVLIDTGLGVVSLRQEHPDLFEREPLLLLTHAHLDHIGAAHEFTERWVHPSEAATLEQPPAVSLRTTRYPQAFLDEMVAQGLPAFGETLLDELPSPDYDVDGFALEPAPATGTFDEGDLFATGDRLLRVLHLPGHSPGSVGFFEERTGTLFAGDAVYDEPLLDELEGSDIPDYLNTMKRLLELPVETVHPGHAHSFDQSRLQELCQEYIDWRGNGA